jgi:hypothetical protein
MAESIVVAKDFTYRVNVAIRNEPLTGKFSYVLWDAVTREKITVQTQFATFDDAAKAAGEKMKQLMTGSASDAEASLVKELIALREIVEGHS